jgi:PadR family transcriptional regulator PadR
MARDSLGGHVELLLLALLDDGPAYGYAVIEALRARSGGRFDLPEGTVYPALHRLERTGLLSSVWEQAGTAERRRRVYTLTADGKVALRERQRDWEQFATSMAGVLGETYDERT